MRKNRNFWAADVIIVLLAVAFVAAAVMLALTDLRLLIPVGAVVVVVFVVALIGLSSVRKGVRRVLSGKVPDSQADGSGFGNLMLPVAILSGDTLVWYNEAFRDEVAGGADCALLPARKMLPGLDMDAAAAPGGQALALAGRQYTAFCSVVAQRKLSLVLFVDDTALKADSAEYHASRPAVLYFVMDTYDEILKEMRESDRARIVSEVDLALERYIGRTSGFLRRVTSSRYIAVVEQRHLAAMLESRFDILDTVRRTDEESGLVTLSVGVGYGGQGFKACEEMALQALDMALGRGGDQAAVHGPDGFAFYGGVAKGVEKRNRVKSRIIAGTLREVMQGYDRVLVMGHREADMDALGAAVGMLRFARICGREAAIVLDSRKTLADQMVHALYEGGYGEQLLPPEAAYDLAGERTLLVVVDTHMRGMLESPDVYDACGGVMVIDHHRRMVGHIADAVINYHEPYASSASELVSELLMYVTDMKENRLMPLEAEALLAGIMLDTRTFSLHVGVRTFEAAAFLRRMGAETETVKQWFSSSMDDYLYRSHLVSEAKIYRGCAFVVSDKLPVDSEVVAPQAANDLLTIEGVQASFVAIRQGGQMRISARSMGRVNVQVVMETMGGGGHLTMAGAQLDGAGVQETEERLVAAIDRYWEENSVSSRV